jgi:hypothetical protein
VPVDYLSIISDETSRIVDATSAIHSRLFRGLTAGRSVRSPDTLQERTMS